MVISSDGSSAETLNFPFIMKREMLARTSSVETLEYAGTYNTNDRKHMIDRRLAFEHVVLLKQHNLHRRKLSQFLQSTYLQTKPNLHCNSAKGTTMDRYDFQRPGCRQLTHPTSKCKLS